MAHVSTDAWQHPAENDRATHYPGRLGDVHNVHFGVHKGQFGCELDSSDSDGFCGQSGSEFPKLERL